MVKGEGGGSTIKAGCLGGVGIIGPHGTPETGRRVFLEQLCSVCKHDATLCASAVFQQCVFQRCIRAECIWSKVPAGFRQGRLSSASSAELQTGQR